MRSRKWVPRAGLRDEFTHRSAMSPHSLIHVISANSGKSHLEQRNVLVDTMTFTPQVKLCDCGKLFSHVFNLRWQHMTHPREKACQCHPCGEGLLQRSYLRNDNPMHSGEKLYECGKAFSHGFSLEHVAIHTGEKPCECFLYDKAFSQRYYLEKQERVHPGKKVYESHQSKLWPEPALENPPWGESTCVSHVWEGFEANI